MKNTRAVVPVPYHSDFRWPAYAFEVVMQWRRLECYEDYEIKAEQGNWRN